MKPTLLFCGCLLAALCLSLAGDRRAAGTASGAAFFAANDPRIQYTGRVDFSNPKRPRFWSPGVYLKARFTGSYCDADVTDEALYGKSHNFLEVAVDGHAPFRIQTTGPNNTFRVAQGLSPGPHTLTLCKDTEAGIGFLEFVGLHCAGLLPPPPRPAHKLEFIGDSITCGTGSDESKKPCGAGDWYDQHNAYLSYGPATARRLGAQWQVTAVSGIGLIHSCCGMALTMPQVFDKTNLRENALPWDFRRYQPDAVTVCLGQNDGAQDPAAFDAAYLGFLKHIRQVYPRAQIICLTSPMADASLTAYQKARLTQIVARANETGDRRVLKFFFSRQYHHGCGGHPDLAEHQQIAGELAAFLKTLLGW